MMPKKEKLVFFDLDDTIVKTNTFHRFIIYEIVNNNLYGILIILYAVFIRKLRIISSLDLKNRILKLHKYKTKQEIEQYFLKFYQSLIKYYDKDVSIIINNLIKKGYEVIIITGAFYEYSVLIANYLGIKEVIATRLNYNKDRFTGNIKGVEMLGKEKKRFIVNSKYKDRSIIFFSDSYLDKPLLDYSYKGYIVSLGNRNHKIRLYRKDA